MSVSGHDLTRNMSFEIVGREEGRATVEAFVGRAEGGASALVLEGEAGIGKSTLWLAGVEVARSRGLRVLLSRPVEAERGLAHAGLGDLFEDCLVDVAPLISRPRRRALEIALLREEARDDPVDHRALGVAVRDVLHLLSERKPILLAVDDVQWLDPSSSSALAFALRRLDACPVLVLLARRLVAGAEPAGLEQALEARRVERLPIGPLSVGALHRLLRDRFGRSFARQTLLRIHERSGGNPFFALELARVLDVDVDPLEPLPVPERLDELVRGRLAGLPSSTRDALALASALGTPVESLLERAGIDPDALAPAVAAHVIERENGTIRFTHPLLSSAVYPESGAERRSVHGRIAQIVDDPMLRARHLALSTNEPDAGVAGALDEAARLAANRGAPATAAELAEQAVRLTPPDRHDERDGRALAAARAHHSAGEWTRARSIASDLLAETEIGLLRAEALVLLAEAGERQSFWSRCSRKPWRKRPRPPGLRSIVHSRLAWPTCFQGGCVPALDHARVALALADAEHDDAGRIMALTALAAIGVFSGDAAAPRHAARAHELATAAGDAKLLEEAVFAVAAVRISCRSNAAARLLLQREYDDWRERDELRSARALWSLAWVEIWAGRWEGAADHAMRSRDLKLQYGTRTARGPPSRGAGRSPPGRARPRAGVHGEDGGALGGAPGRAGTAPPCDAWPAPPVERRRVRRHGLAWQSRPAGQRARVGRALQPLVERRLRRGVARTRPDRRRCAGHRPLGGRRDAASGKRLGSRPRGAVPRVSSPPPAARSSTPHPFWNWPSQDTKPSEIPSDGPGRYSGSASSAGASGRSGLPATRSPRPSASSSGSVRRPGSRLRAPSWAVSGGELGSRV